MDRKSRKVIVITLILLICTVMVFADISVMKKFIRNYTIVEVEKYGYNSEDIKEIKINHSYLNRVLGYNEWRISVEFEKIEDIYFWFSYKDGKARYEGTGAKQSLSPEKYMEYSDKFKTGTLLND